MEEHPPSTIRVVKYEPIGPTEVRITMEMVAKVDRLAEVCSGLMHTAAGQIAAKRES